MRIVLDTHIVVHAARGALTAERQRQLETPASELFIPAVCLWEITKLVELGHLAFPDGFGRFMRELCEHPRYRIAHYNAELMIELLNVAPKMHKDPADQLVVATARVLEATLMTDDGRIRRDGLVPVC